MARKKTAKQVVSAKPPCPECGGRKFGRGYNHTASCTLNFKNQPKSSKDKAGKGRGGRRKNRVRSGGEVSMGIESALIARMPIDAVVQLRRVVEDVLHNRQGEVKRMVKELKALLA